MNERSTDSYMQVKENKLQFLQSNVWYDTYLQLLYL